MLARCYNPRSDMFYLYGARGIKVCPEWHDFWKFVQWCEETYEEGKSIDRINNNGPYSSSNCRWATAKEQQANARKTPEKVLAVTIARQAHKKLGWKGNMRRVRDKKGRYAGNE